MILLHVRSQLIAHVGLTGSTRHSTVTLPVLREQVATHLGVNQDALRDGESKKVLMDCFQQHLVEQSAVVTKKNDTVEGSSDGDDLIDEPVSRRKKKSPSKPTVRAKTASAKPKQKTSAGKSAGEAQLERLKSYVFKCGVRKIWYTSACHPCISLMPLMSHASCLMSA